MTLTSAGRARLHALYHLLRFEGDVRRLRRAAVLAAALVIPPLVCFLATHTSYASELGLRGSVLAAEPWRLLTAWLVHLSLFHLVSNLVCILGFGMAVGYLMGARRTLVVVVLAELVSGIASAVTHPHPLSLGASGIAFALIGAFAAILLARPGKARGEWLVALSVLGWGVLSLYASEGPRVDSAAHVAGFVAGLLLTLAWLRLHAEPEAARGAPTVARASQSDTVGEEQPAALGNA